MYVCFCTYVCTNMNLYVCIWHFRFLSSSSLGLLEFISRGCNSTDAHTFAIFAIGRLAQEAERPRATRHRGTTTIDPRHLVASLVDACSCLRSRPSFQKSRDFTAPTYEMKKNSGGTYVPVAVRCNAHPTTSRPQQLFELWLNLHLSSQPSIILP